MSSDVKSNPPSTWIFFLPFLYFVGFLALGTAFFWTEALESPAGEGTAWHWTKLIFSSFAYLLLGGIGFFAIAIYTLYKLIRGNALFLAIRRHWPLLLAVVYFFLPNLPGPLDEIVVSAIMSALATYFGFRSEKRFTAKNSV